MPLNFVSVLYNPFSVVTPNRNNNRGVRRVELYFISVTTADVGGAGTNSDIYLRLNNFPDYQSPKGIFLDNPDKDDHERGSTFHVAPINADIIHPSRALPTEVKLDIYQYDNDGPEWKPESVNITYRVEFRDDTGNAVGGLPDERVTFQINYPPEGYLYGTLTVNTGGVVSWTPR